MRRLRRNTALQAAFTGLLTHIHRRVGQFQQIGCIDSIEWRQRVTDGDADVARLPA